MNRKMVFIVFIPIFLFACTSFKSLDNLTDKELIDRYYKTDLNLYMVKRDSGKTGSDESGSSGGYGSAGSGYSSRDTEKIKNLEEKLGVMKQELIRRGYIP